MSWPSVGVHLVLGMVLRFHHAWPVVKRSGEDAVVMDLHDASTWPELMTPEEVAQVMRVDKQLILTEIREGRMATVLDTPRVKRIPKWAVRGVAEASSAATLPPAVDGPDPGE